MLTFKKTLILLSLVAVAGSRLQTREVVLASTTSTRDTGLLDSLLPRFEARSGYRVKLIAVGTGQALALARRGDADVVLVHAPEAERTLFDSGYFVRDRKSTRLNSSHSQISYAVFCLKKKKYTSTSTRVC